MRKSKSPDPTPEEIKEMCKVFKAKELERLKQAPDRWHPITFNTPIYTLPGVKN